MDDLFAVRVLRYLLRRKPAKTSHSHYLRYVLTVCMWRRLASDLDHLVTVSRLLRSFLSWWFEQIMCVSLSLPFYVYVFLCLSCPSLPVSFSSCLSFSMVVRYMDKVMVGLLHAWTRSWYMDKAMFKMLFLFSANYSYLQLLSMLSSFYG